MSGKESELSSIDGLQRPQEMYISIRPSRGWLYQTPSVRCNRWSDPVVLESPLYGQKDPLSQGSTDWHSVSHAAHSPSSDPPRKDSADQGGWDGPDDPENPSNWPKWRRLLTVALVSTISFLTPAASSICAPAVGKISEDFGNTNTIVSSFYVSIYVLGFAVGPVLLAPSSEVWGRSVIYHLTNTCVFALTIGCALANSTVTLLVLRFLAGCFGAAPLAVGGGTIADVSPPSERGKYMAFFSVGGLIGPVFGPIIGGVLVATLGWRWCFWILVILSGCVTVLTFIVLKETHVPTILKRRAHKRRKQESKDPEKAMSINRILPTGASDEKIGHIFFRATVRPIKLLATSPIALALASYLALVYGYLYLLFTTFTSVFQQQYGWPLIVSGLAYVGLGIGTVLGLLINGYGSDRIVERVKKRSPTGEASPEARLIMMIVTAPFVTIGLFWYGWSADAKTPWIVPQIGTAVAGIGMLSASISAQVYMVDTYTEYAASALAATTLLRSLAGALLPIAGPPLYDSLGYGWGNSVLAFVSLIGCIAAVFLWKYGAYLREKFPFSG